MYQRHTYGAPERKFATSLPVGMGFLSVVVITAHLLVTGAWSDNGRPIATVLPKPIVATPR